MKRVLLVDDEPELTEVVREYDVVTANSGTAALASVRQGPPDVVFLDISMPGPSGIDVLKELRRSHPTLPVIMVTVTPTWTWSRSASGPERSPSFPSRST